VVCDIRGFSTFSKNHEAPDIAMFSKRFYVKLLEEYFVDTDFAKPTGDGLLLLFKYTEDNLHAIAESVLKNCLNVVRDFPTMMANDSMINYKVPDAVGFGIARGTAFCLYSADEVVDYSGQTLNLASRLNEFARPHGVVVDGSFLMSVFPERLRSTFYVDMVFVRGISEDIPREVFYSTDVVIPIEAKTPKKKYAWKTVDHNVSVGVVRKMPGNLTLALPEEPLLSTPCLAKVQWLHSTAPRYMRWANPEAPEYIQWRQLPFTQLERSADGFFVHIKTDEILSVIEEEGLNSKAKLSIRIQYVPATAAEA